MGHAARSRLAWTAVFATLVLLVIGMYYLARLQSRLDPGSGGKQADSRQTAGAGRVEWLAVLPLRNLTGDTNQETYVLGMTDLLTTELAHIGRLQVKSFTTAMTYQGTRKPASEIGRELQVDALVEGSMQRDANEIIVNVQLIDASHDRHLWSKQFKRAAADVWKIKGELAEQIAAEIRVTLTPEEQRRLATARTRKPEAVEQYLKGRYLVNSVTLADLTASTNYFQRALELEPDWAEPYAGMAQAYFMISSAFRAPKEAMPLVRSNALQALRFDPNLAEAHCQVGLVKLLFDYQFDEAALAFQRSLKLNPNLASAHDGYAMFFCSQSRHAEAITEDETAYRLDPLSAYVAFNYVTILFNARQFERALRQGLSVLEIQKDNHMAAGFTALAYAYTGQTDKAISFLEPRCSVKDRPPMALAILGYCYALDGQTEAARRTAAEVERIASEKYVCVYEIATVYAALGDADAAFQWLDKAFEARADCIPFTKTDPRLDRLHTDPRFNRLLRKIGFRIDTADPVR